MFSWKTNTVSQKVADMFPIKTHGLLPLYMTDKLKWYFSSLELSQGGWGWGSQTSSTCDISTVKLSTSGVYWCESKHRHSSNTVNITVTGTMQKLHHSNCFTNPFLPVSGHCSWYYSNHRFDIAFNSIHLWPISPLMGLCHWWVKKKTKTKNPAATKGS